MSYPQLYALPNPYLDQYITSPYGFWSVVCPTNDVYRYSYVIMSTMASQITSVKIVDSTVCSEVDQRKHQRAATPAFVWNSPVTGEFPAQRVSNTENVSIWWRHHVAILPTVHCLFKSLHLISRFATTYIMRSITIFVWNITSSPLPMVWVIIAKSLGNRPVSQMSQCTSHIFRNPPTAVASATGVG